MALTVRDTTAGRIDAAGPGAGSRGRRLSGSSLAALLIGCGGVAVRIVLLILGVPQTNSDEATMGLAALHVATGVDHPVWFYGQAYMGSLEAWLAAPLIGPLGVGTAPLRLPTLLLYAAFLLLAYRLTRALYPAGLAVLTVALLSLAADRVVKNEMIAGGGYPEILPAAALLVLLAVRLAATVPDVGARSQRPGRRLAAFGAWGLTTGLCLWVDWLVLPYVAAAGLLLLWGCRRELRGPAGALLGAGVLIGAAPLILFNLTAGPGLDSLSAYADASGSGVATLGQRLHGGILLGVPLGTGLCPPSRCAPVVQGWGVAYVALLVAAVVMAVRVARRATGPQRVRELGRLALLGAAALTVVAYLASASSGRTPVESARYLNCLLVTTPAVLWPLWRAATHRATGRGGAGDTDPAAGERPRRAARLWSRPAATVALALVLTAAVTATVAFAAEVPRYRQAATQQRELIAALDRVGATRIYAGYWTCNRITYATRERIVCAVLADDLTPGFDRYLPYRAMVDGAARPAYVWPVGSPADAAFTARVAATGTPVTMVEAGGHRIYLPAHRLP